MAKNDSKRTASTDQPETSEVLVASGEQFRLMVEAVKDYGIFMLDPEGYVATWNEGAERIKGYKAEEIIGRHFSDFYPPEAIAREWPWYELKVARKEGRFEDEGWRLRKDGSRFWANVVITTVYDDAGGVLGFTKVTRDLSERRRHEEALRESEERLRRSNEELAKRNADLRDFAHFASHDLQEPLRKIQTFSEMLEQAYEEVLDEEGRMFLDRIRASAARMSDLVSDLLEYSRVDTRGQSFQTVDLNEVVDDVIGNLQILIGETEGRVEPGALPRLKADPSQMRQLFQNLVGNALKYHRRGVPPVVRITCEPFEEGQQEGYTIVVADNGIGFDEKYAEQIFTPFRRLHTRREFAGSGLGLAICKRIVERHRGSISARSELGQGSVFTIRLPASSADRRAPTGG